MIHDPNHLTAAAGENLGASFAMAYLRRSWAFFLGLVALICIPSGPVSWVGAQWGFKPVLEVRRRQGPMIDPLLWRLWASSLVPTWPRPTYWDQGLCNSLEVDLWWVVTVSSAPPGNGLVVVVVVWGTKSPSRALLTSFWAVSVDRALGYAACLFCV